MRVFVCIDGDDDDDSKRSFNDVDDVDDVNNDRNRFKSPKSIPAEITLTTAKCKQTNKWSILYLMCMQCVFHSIGFVLL